MGEGMRLIDATALRKKLSCAVDSFIDIGDLLDEIDAAPTIPAAPVAHSYWGTAKEVGIRKGHRNFRVCMNCKKVYGFGLADKKYCWECGAKMDLK